MVTDNSRVSRTDPPASNRRWWIIGTVLITAFTAAIVALGIYLQRDQVRFEVFSYEVVDDQTTTVTFDVHRPQDTEVVCRATAIALDFATVGTVDVPIAADAAGGAGSLRTSVTIRTTTRANTGTITDCVLAGPRSQ